MATNDELNAEFNAMLDSERPPEADAFARQWYVPKQGAAYAWYAARTARDAENARLRAALEALKPYAAHKAGCRSLRCFAVVRESDGLKCGEPLGWRHTSSHPTEPGECDEACGLAALLKEEV